MASGPRDGGFTVSKVKIGQRLCGTMRCSVMGRAKARSRPPGSLRMCPTGASVERRRAESIFGPRDPVPTLQGRILILPFDPAIGEFRTEPLDARCRRPTRTALLACVSPARPSSSGPGSRTAGGCAGCPGLRRAPDPGPCSDASKDTPAGPGRHRVQRAGQGNQTREQHPAAPRS